MAILYRHLVRLEDVAQSDMQRSMMGKKRYNHCLIATTPLLMGPGKGPITTKLRPAIAGEPELFLLWVVFT